MVKIMKEDGLEESNVVYAQALIICTNVGTSLAWKQNKVISTLCRCAGRIGGPDPSRCYLNKPSYCGSLCCFTSYYVDVELYCVAENIC